MVGIIDRFNALETPSKVIVGLSALTLIATLILLPMSFHEVTTQRFMKDFYNEADKVRNWHLFAGSGVALCFLLFCATLWQLSSRINEAPPAEDFVVPLPAAAIPLAPDVGKAYEDMLHAINLRFRRNNADLRHRLQQAEERIYELENRVSV